MAGATGKYNAAAGSIKQAEAGSLPAAKPSTYSITHNSTLPVLRLGVEIIYLGFFLH